jgi:hypothetical protein
MNPFPEKIVVPTTANRLPVSLYETLIERLLELNVDAAAFLMPDNMLRAANDSEAAKKDLIGHLPANVHAVLFPPPKRPRLIPARPTAFPVFGQPADSAEGDSGGGGMGAGLSLSLPLPPPSKLTRSTPHILRDDSTSHHRPDSDQGRGLER